MTLRDSPERRSRGTAWPAIASLGLTLVGCAAVRPGTDRGAEGVLAHSGAPPPIAGYDWFLDTGGDEAKLAFGQADSDDLALALVCTAGAGRLTLTRIAPIGTTDILLESGGDTERFDAVSEASPPGDGVFLTAQADPDTPLFQRFRQLGWMAVWQDGQRQTLVPQAGSIGNVERFFGLCG